MIDLAKLTLEQLSSLSRKVECEFNRRQWDREAKNRESRKRYEQARKERDAILVPKIKEYLKTLRAGSIIKLRGASRKGIRKFLAYTNGGGFGERIIAQIHDLRYPSFLTTEHMADKLTHIRVDGKWLDIKEVIENNMVADVIDA